ncbi:MAG: hypothetical protein PWP41_1376 [Moorella sp. (in: firmicutes)]|nr:hypothetical protein [Moorella sp. (in: firmicutes)]
MAGVVYLVVPGKNNYILLPGGDGMLWPWLAGLLMGMVTLLLVPIRLEVVYRRTEQEERLWLELNLPGDRGLWEVEIPSVQAWLAPLHLETLLQAGGTGTIGAGKRAVKHPGNAARTVSRLIGFIVRGRLAYWLGLLRKFSCIWQRFYGRVTCRRLRLFLTLGMEEPATTALAYGSAWALLALLYQNLQRRARLDFQQPELLVRPRFNAPGLLVDFNCIFTFRLGYIISAGLLLLRLLLGIFWQARGASKDARTSHRSLDEDSHGKHQRYG